MEEDNLNENDPFKEAEDHLGIKVKRLKKNICDEWF